MRRLRHPHGVAATRGVGSAVAFPLADGRNAERDAVAALRDPRLDVAVARAVDPDELAAVDDSFRRKYAASPYVDSVVSDAARALTFRVQPRGQTSRVKRGPV